MKKSNNIRLFILNKSLEIEDLLSKILKEIIRIPKSDSKTLSNKSSSLSFKTKADLLYDLDRINKEEYNLLILFMEIRNQFIHNIEATTFEKVFQVIGNNKKNKILKLDSDLEKNYQQALEINDENFSSEVVLKMAFTNLKLMIDKLLIREFDNLVESLKSEDELKQSAKLNSISEKMLDLITKTIDEFGESYEQHLKKITGKDIGFNKTLNNYINSQMEKKMKENFPDIFDKDKNVS
ncbi:hypothetical protein VDP25_17555 [Winogradskyella sp. ECml5-4]|uniref:hypothetical protein n=1 Tax=Winogradskyella sp. ECml5-4 TaxID=3110975 RepID=UPI002FF16AA6